MKRRAAARPLVVAAAPWHGPRQDAARLESVPRLRLEVARRLDGLLSGRFRGLRVDAGEELESLRPYVPGDDVRLLAWTATARTGQPTTRTLVADHELEVSVVIDRTSSMRFGTACTTKAHTAAVLLAAVGHLAAGPGHRLRVVLVHDDSTEVVGPGPVPLVLERALRRAFSETPDRARHGIAHGTDQGIAHGAGPQRRAAAGGGRDPLAVALNTLRPSRRGLILVISDLIPPGSGLHGTGRATDALSAPLRRFRVAHDVLVLEIVDPRELVLPDVGHLHLLDPESGAQLQVNTADRAVRERFARAASARRVARREAVRRCGADLLVLGTDQDWLRELAAHLLRRNGSHRRVSGSGVPA